MPLVVRTTLPSGAPISSSCSKIPRWVWNCLPAASVIVCIRPFGSVSCTRSPAANGPRDAASAPVGCVMRRSLGAAARAHRGHQVAARDQPDLALVVDQGVRRRRRGLREQLQERLAGRARRAPRRTTAARA